MPSVDTQRGLQALNDIRRLVDTWPALQARLGGGGASSAANVRVHTSEPAPLPINLTVSDLMADLDWNLARHYARVLNDDYLIKPEAWTTRALLQFIAENVGHLITDQTYSEKFVTDAGNYRATVDSLIDTRAPLRYWGECPTEECPGELYMRDDEAWVKCELCTMTHTIQQLTRHIERTFDGADLVYHQIRPALKILGCPVTARTLQRWVEARPPKPARLQPIDDTQPPRYPLAAAAALARAGRKHAP